MLFALSHPGIGESVSDMTIGIGFDYRKFCPFLICDMLLLNNDSEVCLFFLMLFKDFLYINVADAVAVTEDNKIILDI